MHFLKSEFGLVVNLIIVINFIQLIPELSMRFRLNIGLLFLFLVLKNTLIFSQDNNIKEANIRTIKMNSLIAIGFVNPAFEFGISEKKSIQLESLGIFYPSGFWGIDGRPLTVVATWIEGRHYFINTTRGLYLGLNTGCAYYRTSKDKGYWDNHIIQFGAAIMIGASIGYKYVINDKFCIDFSYGNGWNASNYEGWNNETGTRNVRLNWSHDFLPLYKGGILICYSF